MRANFVAVQADMRAEHYRTVDAFRDRVLDLARRAVEGVDNAPTLIAFPEAIALPLAFTALGVADAPDMRAAVVRASRRHAGSLLRHALRTRRIGPSLFFHAGAERVFDAHISTFAEAARLTRATVVAGTAFLPRMEREPSRGTWVAGDRVENVAYTLAPTGTVLARTGKAYLMPRERRAGLAPVAPESVRPVETSVGRMGVAICLDGFHALSIDRLDGAGVSVVVQPSANHAPWMRPWPPAPSRSEGDAWLGHGLRAQIQERLHVEVGVNPMLVGRFLDLEPQGRSTIVVNDRLLPGHAVEGWRGLVAIAPSADREAFVRATLEVTGPTGAPGRPARAPAHPGRPKVQ